MMLMRPAKLADLDDLEELASQSSGGLTTLPPDRRLLHEKIERSLFAFSRDVIWPKGEAYLFVLEDTEEKRVVGCSGILSKTGGYQPLLAYKVSSSKPKTLSLQRIHDGPTEVGTLYLHPDYRGTGVGRLLSFCRFIFIALNQERFDPKIQALFRGVIEEDGSVPFWDDVAGHFFPMDYNVANLQRFADPRFMEKHAPEYPFYIPLLSPRAREVIGKCHANTGPAVDLLEEEGFKFNRLVDIFDAGPFFGTEVAKLWTTKNLRKAKVGRILKRPPKGPTYLVSNRQLDFRCTLCSVKFEPGRRAILSTEAAAALKVKRGDEIAYRPRGKK